MDNKQLTVNRVEHKYYISYSQAVKLSQIFNQVLISDEHNSEGGYVVKSLYFDTPSNTDYFSKENGAYFHQKLRLRIYDENYALIKLENKRKFGDKQTKDSIIVSREEAECLIAGDYSFLLDMENKLAMYSQLLETIYS